MFFLLDEDVNPSFETINTQPVFQDTHTTQADTTTHTKTS